MRTLSSSHSVSLGHTVRRGCPDEWVVKNPPASAGDAGDTSSISGLGRSPREGTGYLFQSFCLGNPVERRAWQATVHGVAKSRTWLSVHARTVKKLLNCINSSLPLIFHLYGPACYFWLHRFFHNGGPTSIYISFPETYNGVFQLQSHQFEPVLCPISWANESDELNYGRVVFGTVCLSWQVTCLPSKVWFLWLQILQVRLREELSDNTEGQPWEPLGSIMVSNSPHLMRPPAV